MERSAVWDENLHFALIFSDFIIKQKVRFYEPTRYESQLYEQILKKIAAFRARITSKNGIGRLSNVLQKNVVVSKPKLVEHQINTELEYRSLERNYESLLNSGYPNSTFSDKCEAIKEECIKMITSNEPTYGYYRMHQILILYILMHHTCAPHFGSPIVYEILSTQHCSEVYREHRILARSYLKVAEICIQNKVRCVVFLVSRSSLTWQKFGKLFPGTSSVFATVSVK
ncbi:unnamed protein product [Ceratitis capitata]|uniref:(Mediterranean fruit fly) hypothetical protein n=1 Tax=Ceratitis capitata TaxID=7213 RepID=A0A811VHW0_CERCA|nr:unnamed protein product [Ceratitis capitata]